MFHTDWVHLRSFRYSTKLGLERANIVQLMQKSTNEVVSVLFATNIADPHHWTINTCFGAFCNVRVHLVPYRYRTKLGAKRAELEQSCEDSCHEVASEFFIMNAPDPRHWTLNSCFTAFSTIWLYLGPFFTAQN